MASMRPAVMADSAWPTASARSAALMSARYRGQYRLPCASNAASTPSPLHSKTLCSVPKFLVQRVANKSYPRHQPNSPRARIPTPLAAGVKDAARAVHPHDDRERRRAGARKPSADGHRGAIDPRNNDLLCAYSASKLWCASTGQPLRSGGVGQCDCSRGCGTAQGSCMRASG